MLSKLRSFGLCGLEGYEVSVETDVSNGLPSYDTVGLPSAAVRESKERVRAAIANSGLRYPMSRITVNLAPADTKKEGTVYDLPIAMGMLSATGQVIAARAEDYMMLGELALDGSVRGVAGILPMMIAARESGVTRVMIPRENADEAAYIEGLEIVPVDSLNEAVRLLREEQETQHYPTRRWSPKECAEGADFSEIRGQQGAKRAAEIAAAGGHNLLLSGTPGSGKTMLARRIPGILPELTFEEALEITRIHSITGVMRSGGGLAAERPFRAPHHSASSAAIVGGGSKAMPGEVSLAHFGVLFLDEFPEFARDVLEALRQPLEDGEVTVTRASSRATYPARFMLVAAMNPCPCGNYGSRINECRCTPYQIQRYRARLSGPLMDRIDLCVEMNEVGYDDITAKAPAESSAVVRARVNAARAAQRERYKNEPGTLFNAQLSGRQVRRFSAPDSEGEALLKQAFSALHLSARAYDRVLKVARTIADLDGSEGVTSAHIAEAVQYRSLENKYRSV